MFQHLQEIQVNVLRRKDSYRSSRILLSIKKWIASFVASKEYFYEFKTKL